MTKKSTLTSNNISFAPVVQIPYIIAILYLKIPKTLFFKGFNITNFHNQYKLMYINF